MTFVSFSPSLGVGSSVSKCARYGLIFFTGIFSCGLLYVGAVMDRSKSYTFAFLLLGSSSLLVDGRGLSGNGLDLGTAGAGGIAAADTVFAFLALSAANLAATLCFNAAALAFG